jgi:hypothetical protein
MLSKTLLSSTAVILTVIGAQAADLPSKKAAPATYVKICDAYGAGFFYIPGTETCVKLGGVARLEFQYTPGKDTVNVTTGLLQQSSNVQSTTGWFQRARLRVDARTPTSMGVARTFIALRAENTSGLRNVSATDKAAYTMSDSSTTAIKIDTAFVQWAGFTFGQGLENYHMMPSNPFGGVAYAFYGTSGVKEVAYTATLGDGLSATLAIEDHKDLNYSQTAFSQPATAANIVGNLRMDQAWGFAALSAMVGNNSLNNTVIDNNAARQGQTTFGGYSVGATVSYKLPMIAAGDQVWFTTNYAKGMLGGLMGSGGISTLGGVNRLLGGVVRVDSNVVQTGGVVGSIATPATYGLTSGWNIAAEYVHYWAPQWRSLVSAGYVSLSAPTVAATIPSAWGSGKLWEVSTNLIYSPIKDMDIGLEVQYANLKNTIQNPTNAFVAAGRPGLSVNNFTTKFRAERAF